MRDFSTPASTAYWASRSPRSRAVRGVGRSSIASRSVHPPSGSRRFRIRRRRSRTARGVMASTFGRTRRKCGWSMACTVTSTRSTSRARHPNRSRAFRCSPIPSSVRIRDGSRSAIDGRYVYPDGGVVIDTRTKQVVARIPTSEKLIEVDFERGKPVRVGHR